MGLYRWTRGLVYSGDLVRFDDSSSCGCVKTPDSKFGGSSGDNNVSESVSDAVEMLNAAIVERMNKTPVKAGDDKERILGVADRLMYIPRFGYFMCSLLPVEVTLKNGESASALVGVRCYSRNGKTSPFYIFQNDSGSYSGKIGNFSVNLWDSSYDSDKVAYHFMMVSYQNYY